MLWGLDRGQAQQGRTKKWARFPRGVVLPNWTVKNEHTIKPAESEVGSIEGVIQIKGQEKEGCR